jgi:hypothetical protein
MTHELIDIINIIKAKFTDNSDMLWTSYETPEKVRDELDNFIDQLKKGHIGCLENLNIHFLSTSTFQKHSIQNGWIKEYMKLS